MGIFDINDNMDSGYGYDMDTIYNAGHFDIEWG